jgi:hypothetical protein
MGQISPYSSPDWMTIPFREKPRDARQCLADIELMIPVCMQMLQIDGDLRDVFETSIPHHVDLEPCRELTQRLLQDLEDWALRYATLLGMAQDHHDLVVRSASQARFMQHTRTDGEDGLILMDTCIARMASVYVATKLILNTLMHKMEAEGNVPQACATSHHYNTAAQCAQKILRTIASVDNAQSPAFDLLRYIPPLVTVACVGPGASEFKISRAILKKWATRIGSRGTTIELNALLPASPHTAHGIVSLHGYYIGRGAIRFFE